jgi:hypothetical protein
MESTDTLEQTEEKHKDVEMEVDGEKLEGEIPAEDTPVEEEQPKGKPIGPLVNQEFVSIIMEMGFTKPVAEKSLLFTANQSVEAAMDWIQQHQEDADFLVEEFLAEDPTSEDPNKPKLTKEEKIAAAKELQQRLRAKREAEEKKLEEEREKNRIQSTKELQKAKKIMDEQQMKLRMEIEKKERIEFMKEKKRMEELLRKVEFLYNLLGSLRKGWKKVCSRGRDNCKEKAINSSSKRWHENCEYSLYRR